MLFRSEDQETLTSDYSPETGSRHVEDLPAFGTATAVQPMDETRVIAPRPKAKKRSTRRKRKTAAQSHNGVQSAQSAPSLAQDLSNSAQGPSPVAESSSSAFQAQASSSGGGVVKSTAEEVAGEDRRVQGMGLRRLCHSRLVVNEVCLPLMRFANSKQLVTVVADAIAGTRTGTCLTSNVDILII